MKLVLVLQEKSKKHDGRYDFIKRFFVDQSLSCIIFGWHKFDPKFAKHGIVNLPGREQGK